MQQIKTHNLFKTRFDCYLIKKIVYIVKNLDLFKRYSRVMVKGTKGIKVKIIFQGLHMMHVIFVLVYNFKICITGTPFNNAF